MKISNNVVRQTIPTFNSRLVFTWNYSAIIWLLTTSKKCYHWFWIWRRRDVGYRIFKIEIYLFLDFFFIIISKFDFYRFEGNLKFVVFSDTHAFDPICSWWLISFAKPEKSMRNYRISKRILPWKSLGSFVMFVNDFKYHARPLKKLNQKVNVLGAPK